MEYIVFTVVVVVGVIALSGLSNHINKEVVRSRESETQSYMLIKEYLLMCSMDAGLDNKIKLRNELKEKMKLHVSRIDLIQSQKEGSVVIRISDYLKSQ